MTDLINNPEGRHGGNRDPKQPPPRPETAADQGEGKQQASGQEHDEMNDLVEVRHAHLGHVLAGNRGNHTHRGDPQDHKHPVRRLGLPFAQSRQPPHAAGLSPDSRRMQPAIDSRLAGLPSNLLLPLPAEGDGLAALQEARGYKREPDQ